MGHGPELGGRVPNRAAANLLCGEQRRFRRCAENVAVTNAVSVSSISVLTDGWVFSALLIELSGATGEVNIAAGTTTMLCGISGNLLKTGSGWLALPGGISACSSISVAAGVLNLGGTTAAVNTVTLTGGSLVGGVLNVADTLQLYSGTLSADITGTAALRSLGPNTVVLGGDNSYSGGTNAAAGTLIAACQASLPGAVSGTGVVIVQPTLYGSGSGDWTTCTWTLADGTVTGWIDGANVVIEAGADLSLSTSVNVSALTIQGNATIEGHGTLVLPAGGTTIDVLAGTATFDVGLAGGTPVKTGQGTADFLAPLATPVLVAGGQAIGPGAVFSGNESLDTLDPAMFSLVQSLFVDQSIDRADMIQILESAAVGGAVTPTALAALEMLTTPQNEARLNMPDYVAVLAGDVVNGNPANANYQGQPLGNLADQGTDQLRATALERSGGQVVLRHGPARRRPRA